MIGSDLHLVRAKVGEVEVLPHLASYCQLAACTQLLGKAELCRRRNMLTWKPEKWTGGREFARVTQEQAAASFALILNRVGPQQLEPP